MTGSLLDFFTIGIGPSSSHTVGPMRAAVAFAGKAGTLDKLTRLRCDLYGSLAATGKGHGTDRAILLGWMGHLPDSIDVTAIPNWIDSVSDNETLCLQTGKTIRCCPQEDIVFQRGASLPGHPNGMHFIALDDEGAPILEEVIYSIGGGFLLSEKEIAEAGSGASQTNPTIPFPFSNAEELLALCEEHQLSVSDIALANEAVFRSESQTRHQLDQVWDAMQACVEQGCLHSGTLPGGLKVPRRAHAIWKELKEEADNPDALGNSDPLRPLDWVNLFALAVNEENAAGGRVVTAPTNGAAGVIPAVLHYAVRFRQSPYEPADAVHRFLLTAAAIASLYKENASLSGADVGCQGEVGVACSMAAGAMVEYLGGTPKQVECAAEIGMEHNLGLTCDPVGGLVQIPCIERNAMASVKAINAARLALRGDGTHLVSLDKVIQTMRETGRDMMDKYKETSRGGLAVNVTVC